MKRLPITMTIVALICGAAAAPAQADLALAAAKNCMSCHTMEKKRVGPGYKDVALKYANQPDALDVLAAKIRDGGSGVWGPVPMPAHPNVSEVEAIKLAAWILSLSSLPKQDP